MGKQSMPIQNYFVFFTYLLVLCSWVQAQDVPPSLDDAATVKEVIEWFENEFQEAKKTARDGIALHRALEPKNLRATTKILQLDEVEANAETKIAGLKYLINSRKAAGFWGNNYYIPLLNFLKTLEATSKKPDLVKKERYWVFTELVPNTLLSIPSTDESFRSFSISATHARNWANSPPPDVKPSHPIHLLLDLADSPTGRRLDQYRVRRVIEQLLEFAQSDEFRADALDKKEVVDLLTTNLLIRVNSDPKLYGKTLDDKEFNWDDLRGKYVLIKFTATWCGPCKGELPGMLDAYQKYHDKGLEIVSVYIGERGTETEQVEIVKKAVEEKQLPWIIISEALTVKAGQPKQVKFYAINGVPTMLLVDKEGKIIMQDARSPNLQKKLLEVFK